MHMKIHIHEPEALLSRRRRDTQKPHSSRSLKLSVPPSLRAGSLRLYPFLDLYWRSFKFGGEWYK